MKASATYYTGEGCLFEPHWRMKTTPGVVPAALELQQRLGTHRPAPPLPPDVSLDTCLGVHTGPVVVGPLEGDAQRLYTAGGATSHLATRLQHLAAPGTVVLSDATTSWYTMRCSVRLSGASHCPSPPPR